MANVDTWWRDIRVMRGNQAEKTEAIGKLQAEVDQNLKIINKLKNERFELEKEIHQLIGKIKATDPDFSFKKVIYSNEQDTEILS